MRKLLLSIFLLCACVSLSAKDIYLDEINLGNMLQDWGDRPRINKNIVGGDLIVNGVKYERGIGTHSVSRMLLNVGKKAHSFSGYVGADDQNDYDVCKMEFKIIADEKEIWSSGIMQKGMPAKAFNVDLTGVNKVALVVYEGGDGIMYDHADWLEAKFVTDGEIVSEHILPKPINKPKYILTPKPSDKPRINSAKVFGVRPGSPVLYHVAASGQKPIKYTATNLPKELSLDENTGQITGKFTAKGNHKVVIKAENSKGSDSKTVEFVVGDKICLTPPMGWNSWNCWGPSVNEQKVKDAADFMANRLIEYGWQYVSIDDGWEARERTAEGELIGNEKFPDFKELSDYVHSRGLKFGIYSSPGPFTCAGYPGSFKHEQIDADTWARWGVDLLKYDYCLYDKVICMPTEDLIKVPYDVMRTALDNIDRDIAYCVGYGAPNVWKWGKAAGGNYWRTTRDITDEWNVVTAIGCFQDVCAEATAPGSYNDPDMLVVGKLGMGWGAKAHDSYLTADEQYSHVSLWCLVSSPLLIGCDMNDMDDFTFNLLANPEVLEVNQDPLCAPAKKITKDGGQIWYKEMEDGLAIGFFNMDPYEILWDKSQEEAVQKKNYKMSISLAELGLSGKYKVRDLWRHKDVGTCDKELSVEVPYHGVSFLKLVSVK